jgi:hypothetical protein
VSLIRSRKIEAAADSVPEVSKAGLERVKVAPE